MRQNLMNKENCKDIVKTTILSSIPYVGSFFNAIYENIKSNELNKRYKEWSDLIEYRLSKLEIQMEDLSKNESFVTTIMQATNSAIKTTKNQEKKNYLIKNLI